MTESVARKLAEHYMTVRLVGSWMSSTDRCEAAINEAIRATKEAVSAELEKHAEMARHRGLAEIAHTLDVLAAEFRQFPGSAIIPYLNEVKHG